MYWVIASERVTDDEGGYLEIDDSLALGEMDPDAWPLGHLLGLELAGSVQLVGHRRRGYRDPPPDFHDSRLCLMSERMVRTLRDTGVGNLETYPVTVVSEPGNERWPFALVNVVGLVAAADMAKSEWQAGDEGPLGGAVHFDSLVLDERSCLGLLMFRLAQHRETVLVHDRVRGAFESAGLRGVAFIDPSQWST